MTEARPVANELEALLAVQADDDVVDALDARLRALDPRLAALEERRQALLTDIARLEGVAEAEERKQRELERRVADHRQRQERNLAHLDVVKRMKEATAAMAQVEQAKRLLIEEEHELQGIVRRVADTHAAIATRRAALATLEEEQASEREVIAGERSGIETELAGARAKREETARHVARPLLAKSERIRGRLRAQAVYQLRGPSCAHCDTAIPLHRRSEMQRTGGIEVCEACGVLLYASV